MSAYRVVEIKTGKLYGMLVGKTMLGQSRYLVVERGGRRVQLKVDAAMERRYRVEVSNVACDKCGVLLAAHWLRDGRCNGCRNPHLVVAAT